jgi:hypothetical protein
MKRVFLEEILKTVRYAVSKEQCELVLRGLVGGSALAFLLTESQSASMIIFMVSLWFKMRNNMRK